ncbi:hypothetical protein KRMM14A1004_38980 [Krasilnikovia sp. MM14-A1004]
MTLLTSTVGGANRVALIPDPGEPEVRTLGEAAAGWALSAIVAAAKTARADPAVTILGLIRAP